ncbi:MAG: metallophosphoesterase [Cyanobacteriota bacterium]
MKNEVVVLSDIHIGDDSPTCWYQSKIHGPYLRAILDWVVANAATIREVVLLGDVVDLWTYPCNVQPPSFATIVSKHPDIFGPNEGLGKVMDALGGNVTYVPGNHDMAVTPSDVGLIKSNEGHHLAYAQSPYCPGVDQQVVFTHGNDYTLFNAPDLSTRWSPLPVGHFVTRMVASYWAAHLAPGQNVSELSGQGYPNGLDWHPIIKSVLDKGDVSIAAALIDGIAGKEGVSETAPIILADGSQTTLAEVKVVYNSLFTDWISRNGGDQDGLLVASKAALADYNASYMGWFAQRQAFQSGAKLVVMGHTHEPISGLQQSLVQYVNSGFECPSAPDMASHPVCFVVVDMDTASAKIMKATCDANGAISIAPTTAPTTSIVVSPSEDFSCYATIHNATPQDLTLSQQALIHGHYITLPNTIPAGKSATIWVQDYPLPSAFGSGASVHYRLPDGTDTAFTFSCPTGVYPNSVSGGSSFQAKSGSGDWQAAGKVPTQGHPLFIRYEVLPGALQGHFTGRCGQNSHATSAAGLHPGQSVILNDRRDLSHCIVANNNAAVFSISLQPVSGVYSYQVIVDAQGPEGPFSGSMYLYFTDQTGDRYLLTVFRHARAKHTVSYNSAAPAIVKIEWSNTAL